jgi:polyisoprenoid-binding protein YceI
MSWKIEIGHSKIMFRVRHLMIASVTGSMNSFTGSLDFDTENPVNSSVNVEIDPTSINTRLGVRDNNLRSVLLKVKKHPLITYKSKRIEVLDESHGRIIGDLTIHGLSKEVILDTKMNDMSTNAEGQTTAYFSATTCINRKDWGLKWMPLLEIGGMFVSDNLDIHIDLVAIKVKVTEPQPVLA